MPFLLLSLTTLFPQSGSLQPSVPATEDPLPKPVGSWSPSGLCPVPPRGSSSFTLILVLTWLTLTDDCSVPHYRNFPSFASLPYSLWFCGERKHQGSRPTTWGSQGDVGQCACFLTR